MTKANDLAQNAFNFTPSETPILVSMPHSGLALSSIVKKGLTEKAKALPDTDWYLPELYDFLPELGIGSIQANYSRYVIDLNRPIDDLPLYQSKTTGLFPEILFDESPLFLPGMAPSDADKEQYKSQIWQAYHHAIEWELSRLKEKFGYAILFDAHSIAAEVPMLFDGHLPDFNWGTNDGLSCGKSYIDRLVEQVNLPYSQITNGRFKGGYITRYFGKPNEGIHAIQLELSQATYLNADVLKSGSYVLDKKLKEAVSTQLKRLLKSFLV